jgi:L-ascorbate metabolism protein UlaG (beta-lactamase superfamily)
LITHEHGDHLDSGALNTLRKEQTRIIASAQAQAGLPAALKALTTVLGNGGQTSLLGLTVEAVPAYNANHPKGVGNGYLVTLGGKRLYVSGDTGDTPELRALTGIDLAFLCMNQPYTLTVAQAVGVVREFRPRIIYPYHYRNQGGTYADVDAFKRQVGTDLGIEVRLRKWY